MKIELADIDPDVLEDIIGTDSYDAALAYVRRHAVGRQMWADAHNALFGIVLGSHGDYYTPAIWFSPGPPLEVLRVHCGCAARHGCEHAAALLLSAVEGGAEAAAGRPTIPRQVRRSPAWDASLEAWLPSGPQARRQPETTLAIELTLVSEHGRPVAAPASSRTAPGGPPGPAGQARQLDRQLAELGQARQLRVPPHPLGRAAPAAAGAARPLPGAGRPQLLLLLLRRGTLDRAVRGGLEPALAAARRGGEGRAAARVRPQARCAGAVPGGGALPRRHPARGRRPLRRHPGDPRRRSRGRGDRRPAAVHRHRGSRGGLPGPGRGAAERGPGRLALPPGQAQAGRSRAAAGDDAGRPAARGARRRRGQVPGRVLPAAAADGHGDLLRRFLHPAGHLGPDPGAARVVRRRPRGPPRLGVGVPGR